MPVPRYGLVSAGAPAGHVLPEASLDGLTELRVHGVGGTPPEALLDDLAPQQVAGDQIAGFYRTADYLAAEGADRRHVEGYSWGGLTSRSGWRVLWLLLLPFLLANLAGWMCSARVKGVTKPSWLFRLHRGSANITCLALTINAVLVTTMITADVVAYQAARAGDTSGRWWLAPLRWAPISGHPARQVLLGVAVPVLVVILLAALSRRSRGRYESVPPPVKGASAPPRALTIAAALDGGLSDKAFWDGEHSVRHAGRRHMAASFAFLALVLAITSKATVSAGHGAVRDLIWWWVAVAGGGAAMTLAGIRTCVDLKHDKGHESGGRMVALDERSTDAMLAIAVVVIASAGVFAWLQPGVAATAGQLPGMGSIFRWTMIGAAATVGFVLLASLAGGSARRTLLMGPLVTTIVAFSLLNVTLFGATLSIAHLVGDMTFTIKSGVKQIYVPDVIGVATPALVLAALVAAVLFAVAEIIIWWRSGHGPSNDQVKAYYQEQYDDRQAQLRGQLGGEPRPGDAAFWECSALVSQDADGQVRETGWAARIARAERLGHATRDVGWLLWALAVSELAVAAVTIVLQPTIAPDRWLGKAAVTLATALPVILVGLLRTGWSQPGRRRQIGVLWDVGTFWPRSYHPFAPPCYAERAVPELQRRLWWIDDNHGRVLLAAHSQGSVLAAAALIQRDCLPGEDRTRLVTFGSPLGKLYSWAFPAYVSTDILQKIPQVSAGRWRNIYYPTDPIGGRIFDGKDGGGQPEEDLPRADSQTGSCHVDRELTDPAECWYNYGQPVPRPGRHSGYWTDARVWKQIDDVTGSAPGEVAEVGGFTDLR